MDNWFRMKPPIRGCFQNEHMMQPADSAASSGRSHHHQTPKRAALHYARAEILESALHAWMHSQSCSPVPQDSRLITQPVIVPGRNPLPRSEGVTRQIPELSFQHLDWYRSASFLWTIKQRKERRSRLKQSTEGLWAGHVFLCASTLPGVLHATIGNPNFSRHLDVSQPLSICL